MSDSSVAPTQTILEAFSALAITEGLTNRKSKAYKDRRRTFIADAVRDSFIEQFGVNSSSLQSWQRLCQTILGPDAAAKELTSIKKCKAAIKGLFVNLVDLVDAANTGKTICRTFSSAKELAKYIKRTKKVFPKSRAKANPLLRQFLIVVS